MRQVNQAARELIQKYEGLRLEPYLDGVGIQTIGYGHVITPNDNIGDSITQEQALQLFEKDLSNASLPIEQLVSVDLTDNMYGSLVSFVFNMGGNALRRSTLLKLLNAGDYTGAANQFARWVYAGPAVENGLIERREAEKQLFLTPDLTTKGD